MTPVDLAFARAYHALTQLIAATPDLMGFAGWPLALPAPKPPRAIPAAHILKAWSEGHIDATLEARDAIRDLRVERIGHGVRAIEDPALVEELAARKITLEVCPGSNVVLGLYPDMPSHPIARLRDAGVPVTVSTDDPPFFHTSMRREYNMLAEAFGWEDDDFMALNQTALAAAFCDEDTRARVKTKLEKT